MDPKIVRDYPSLKDLPLYKFYKELDDYNRTNKVSDLCKNIIGNRYLNSSEYIKLCEKLSKILLSIDYIKSKHKKDADTTCSYLSYWLYDKLTQITSASRDIDTVHYALGEVYRSSQLPELWSECYYKYFNKCTKSEFEIIKKLHDYTEAFKDIQSIIHNNGVGTTQKVKDYCAFIADGVRQYNRIIQEYGDCDKSNYCHELIAFKESFDKIDLSSLNCKCKIPLPQPAEKGAANLVQWYRSSGYWSPGDSYEECSLKNNFLFGNFFGSNKLGRFWITLLGSVLIILFLYKFSPLKYWVNPDYRKRKEKSWRNVRDEFQEDYMEDDDRSYYEYDDGSYYGRADGSEDAYSQKSGSEYSDESDYAYSHRSVSEYPDESSSVYTNGSLPESSYESSYHMGYSPPRYQ